MNCLYCGTRVPAPPTDEQGIALLSGCVHLGCVDRWAKDLEVFTRLVVKPVADGAVTFRKYAPLTVSIEEAQLGQRQGE